MDQQAFGLPGNGVQHVLNRRSAVNHSNPFADRGFVLVNGGNRFTDTGRALLANPEVGRAFLGG